MTATQIGSRRFIASVITSFISRKFDSQSHCDSHSSDDQKNQNLWNRSWNLWITATKNPTNTVHCQENLSPATGTPSSTKYQGGGSSSSTNAGSNGNEATRTNSVRHYDDTVPVRDYNASASRNVGANPVKHATPSPESDATTASETKHMPQELVEHLMWLPPEAIIQRNSRKFEHCYSADMQFLGEGASGKVIKAVHKATGQTRAAKIIPKGRGLAREQNTELFAAELACLRDLDHPHIIKLHEYFNDEDHWILVFEMCTGSDLYDKLVNHIQKTKSGLPEKEAGKLIRQMLKALLVLHSKQIIHHDIKPENFIFTRPDGSAPLKLIDFGLAERDFDAGFGSDTEKGLKPKQAGGSYGTAAYMSPEIISSEPYGKQSDIWSIGVILWTMLLGTALFSQRDPELAEKQIKDPNHLKKQLQKHRNKIIKISPDARDLLNKMLHNDPEKRIIAREALNHPFIMKSYCPSDYSNIHNAHLLEQQERMMLKKKMQRKISDPLTTWASLWGQSKDHPFKTSTELPEESPYKKDLVQLENRLIADADTLGRTQTKVKGGGDYFEGRHDTKMRSPPRKDASLGSNALDDKHSDSAEKTSQKSTTDEFSEDGTGSLQGNIALLEKTRHQNLEVIERTMSQLPAFIKKATNETSKEGSNRMKEAKTAESTKLTKDGDDDLSSDLYIVPRQHSRSNLVPDSFYHIEKRRGEKKDGASSAGDDSDGPDHVVEDTKDMQKKIASPREKLAAEIAAKAREKRAGHTRADLKTDLGGRLRIKVAPVDKAMPELRDKSVLDIKKTDFDRLVVEKLEVWAHLDRFQKVVRILLAQVMNYEDLSLQDVTFRQLDRVGYGALTRDVLVKGLLERNIPVPKSFDAIFKTLVFPQAKTISCRTFIAATLVVDASHERLLRGVFDLMANSESDFIFIDDLATLFFGAEDEKEKDATEHEGEKQGDPLNPFGKIDIRAERSEWGPFSKDDKMDFDTFLQCVLHS